MICIGGIGMKKKVILTFLFTIFLVFAPAFLVRFDNEEIPSNKDPVNKIVNIGAPINSNEGIEEAVATFSCSTVYKKTFYVNTSRINVYKDSSGNDLVLRYLKKDAVVVGYKEKNGYIYCEDNSGNKGWIKKTDYNLIGKMDKKTDYNIDIDVTNQKIKVFKGDKILKEMFCSSGIIGDQDTETPLGIFAVQERGLSFFSTKYNQGAKYYIKFFANYLIHSVPTDQKGNIIEEESIKLGSAVSHGCVRVSMENAKWMYDTIPKGSIVFIHY